MPIISTSLPSDGTTIDAADVNTPFNDILNVVNGNLDSDNVATGGLNYDNFGTITGEIPASDMQDSGNIEKFRDEANVAFVASGCVWSTLSGLNGAMTAGVVYNANGARNTPGAVASKTFTASMDTYVDIATNGAVSYSEVTNGAASPALTTDYVRIAKVVTSGAAITSITQSGYDSLNNDIYPSRSFRATYMGLQRATVATSQTTTSTSYADLSTVGPAVTVTIGSSGLALVIMEMTASSNVAGNANLNMSFAASGTNTITAGTQGQMKMGSFAGGVGMTHSFERLLTGLTPGSTTFTAKYATTSGTATFSDRFLTVIPL